MKISNGRAATVMIVEDIDWIRAGMKKALRRHGYRVVEAVDASKALEVAEQEPPDLILTEEELPTFAALIEQLREHPTLHDVPVVIVNPDLEDNSRYGGALVVTDYHLLEPLLTRPSKATAVE